VPSPKLVASVDRLPATDFAARAFRHQAALYDPLSGRGARINGGRWNPPNSFSVLYLALDEATVALEFHRHAARQGRSVSDFLPRTLYAYDLTLQNILDLRDEEARRAVSVTMTQIASDDLGPCQHIGEAAQHVGREGILAPSATGSGSVLAVFLDSISAGSSIDSHALGSWDVPGDLSA